MLSLQAKPFNYPEALLATQKSEPCDSNSSEQSIQDQDQGTWYTTRNPRKQKAAFDGDHKKSNHKNYTKKANNKQEDDQSGKVSGENTTHNGKGNAKGSKKERKPDRQLYSVREKRADNQRSNNKVQKNQEVSQSDFISASVLETVKDSEALAQDDDRSFVSDVSTAISDRLKNLDSDKVPRSDDFKDTLLQVTSPAESKILFTLFLGSEDNYETVLISEGETDYEAFLDKVCERQGITDRAALYFKINILQMAYNVHSDPSQIEPTLNRLLDINYKILMSEMDTEEDEASPLFYGENKDFLGEDFNENFC